MRFFYFCTFLSSVILVLLVGCQKKNAGNAKYSEFKIKELKEYHTLISNKNLLVGLPVRLRYDTKNKHLFIEDLSRQRITEMDDRNKVVHVFGKKGHGPGEVEGIDNFFITQKHLFIVDGNQYLIDKYSLRDGRYISSLDYEQFLKNKIPPHPPLTDINNIPFVTLNETILLPTQTNGRFLYEEINWKGKKLADIGAIPKGYKTEKNEDTYWSDLEHRNVPARDLCEAFPVNDRADSDDIYLVYSAIPKIAKYTLSGRKIWEHKISRTPEVDSLMINLSIRARVVESHPKVHVSLIPVRKYVAGRCDPDGDLFLITYTDLNFPNKYHLPMWIHQFDSDGKLVKRYKIVSKADVDLSFYPAIDFKKNEIFVALVFNNIGIRTYHF